MFEVKVGQEIAFGKYHWGSLIHQGSSTVEKINRHGHIILANGRVFDKNGTERGVYAHGAHLIEINRYRAELAAISTQKERFRLAQEIEQLVHENCNHVFNDELKARLQDMVARL